jgi:lipopolysaccharide transport system permease protein
LAPAFLALALVTALGAGFFLASVNVRYRDVPYIIPVFLQILPLVSGVMYAVDKLPNKWQWVLSLNPMTTVIAGWRWAVLGAAEPNWLHSAVGAGMGLVIFLFGLTVFRTSEPRFADTI